MKRFLDWLFVRRQPYTAHYIPPAKSTRANIIWATEPLEFPAIDPSLLPAPKETA